MKTSPWSSFENFLQDLRYGFRQLIHTPGFTFVTVLTLALGIGANTAVFTLVNGLMLRSLPVNRPQQLFFLGADELSGSSTGSAPTGAVSLYSYRFFQQLREQNKSAFDGLTAIASPMLDIRVSMPNSSGQPRRFTAAMVDGSFFPLMGVNAAVGRLLIPADDTSSNPSSVLVVSYHYWSQSLGRDPQAIGKTVLVNGAPFTIVGVTPPEFYGVKLNSNVPDFWFTLSQQSFLMQRPNWLTLDSTYWLDLVGRLNPKADPRATAAALTTQVQQMMLAVEGTHISTDRAQKIRQSYVELVPGARGLSRLRTRFSPRLQVLTFLVALVLMVTCLNVANLLLARAAGRQREIAVRLAVGGARQRIVRQLLTESLLLAAIGGAVALVLATWATRLLSVRVFRLNTSLAFFDFKPDLRVLAFTFLVSLITGLLFGLAPAFRSTRVDLNDVLKDGLRNSGAAGGSVLSPGKLMVSAQVTLSLVLLMIAALLVRSLKNLEQQDLGFVPDQILTCRLDLASAGYKRAQLPELYSRVIDRVLALPGVRGAAFADSGMLTGSNHTSNISIENYAQKRNENMMIQHRRVTWNYVATNGMTILAGRDISPQDRQEAPHVAVINEAFAQRFFPGENPLGHNFSLGSPFSPPGMRIVGVIKNSKYNSLDEKASPMAFLSLLQEPFDSNPQENKDRPYTYGNELDVRVSGDPRALSQALRRALAEVDSNLPVTGIAAMTQRVDDSSGDARAIAQLSSFFGIVALLLASIGLYGLMAYNISRRTHEIGVRMAIGAEGRNVLAMVMRESLLVVMIGIVLGIPAALGIGRFLSSQLFGLSPRDPMALTAATFLLLLASMLASYLPARRAAHTDPMVALRHE